MKKYRYISMFKGYDAISNKMNELSKQGYQFDNEWLFLMRMKYTEVTDNHYQFIYDKNFSQEIVKYYENAGWKLHKFKFYKFFRLAQGSAESYPIFTEQETELEIIKSRLRDFVVIMLVGIFLGIGMKLFSHFIIANSYMDILNVILAGLCGGIFGFGVGGLCIFIPKYIRLKRELNAE
ncbi:DUF2812 domain-containing protein [Gemella bergeri]|nr:DUF2812 domain-containing protein [Gemella bergeri]